MENCRGCHFPLPEEEILRLDNMPKSAQNLPIREELEEDLPLTLKVKQCPYCGLVQLSGEPVTYYKNVIRATGVSEEMKEFRRDQLSKLLGKYQHSVGKALEIGCGNGEYIEMIRTHFQKIKFWGLENSQSAVEHCLSKKLQVKQGFFDGTKSPFRGEHFDLCFCFNFLEHIPEPSVFLKEIAGHLSEDGIGIIEVPNFDMILQKSLYSEFITDHLMYFTKETLQEILLLNGFQILELNVIWHGYILSAVVKKRQLFKSSEFMEKRTSLSSKVEAYLQGQKRNGSQIAVWGAGHQSFANLSLLPICEYVDCVIDSAPFKQGHYTPATHLPIYGPDYLNDSHIDTVLIMAAGFSKEIIKLMQSKYTKILHIAVLDEDGIEVLK